MPVNAQSAERDDHAHVPTTSSLEGETRNVRMIPMKQTHTVVLPYRLKTVAPVAQRYLVTLWHVGA